MHQSIRQLEEAWPCPK